MTAGVCRLQLTMLNNGVKPIAEHIQNQSPHFLTTQESNYRADYYCKHRYRRSWVYKTPWSYLRPTFDFHQTCRCDPEQSQIWISRTGTTKTCRCQHTQPHTLLQVQNHIRTFLCSSRMVPVLVKTKQRAPGEVWAPLPQDYATTHRPLHREVTILWAVRYLCAFGHSVSQVCL